MSLDSRFARLVYPMFSQSIALNQIQECFIFLNPPIVKIFNLEVAAYLSDERTKESFIIDVLPFFFSTTLVDESCVLRD